MSLFFDRVAGYAGCMTDMDCEQLSFVLMLGTALATIGMLMVICGVAMILLPKPARRL